MPKRDSKSNQSGMTKRLLRRWLAGWRAAEEFHTEEIRRATPAERFAQLEALTQFTEAYGRSLLTPERAREVERVRRRWNELKNAYRNATARTAATARTRDGRGRKAV
jgi:hypothetical protein